MIKNAIILNSTIKQLKTALPNYKIFKEVEEITDKEPCFHVRFTPTKNVVDRKYYNERGFTIDIIYYPLKASKRADMLDMIDTLNSIFIHYIDVLEAKNKIFRIPIKETKEKILNDTFGYYLHYSISCEFFDEVLEHEEFENMQNVDIDF